jgi:hypothetical protein
VEEHFDQDKDALRVFTLYDKLRNKEFPGDFINLAYFEVSKPNIETERQRHWRDYFTTGAVSDNAPDYIKRASDIIVYDNLSKEEKTVLSVRERNEQQFLSERYTAIKRAEALAEARGEKRGEKRRFEDAKKAILLIKQGTSVTEVSKQTGLSAVEVRSLCELLK